MAVFLLNVRVPAPRSQCGASGSRFPILGGSVGAVLSVRDGCAACFGERGSGCSLGV